MSPGLLFRARQQGPGPAPLSLSSNFAWLLTGNLVYASCQWGAIVVLAKLGSSFMIGQFSLGLAIAGPVLMFTNLQLRAVQATDARRLYSFGEYLRLRAAMTLCGMAVIAGVASFGNYARQTAIVILAVGAAKAIESLSDIHYGLFQLNDRLDHTGRSMMIRGMLSVAALGAGLYLTGSIVWSCIALALAWLGALVGYDARRGRSLAGVSATPERQAERIPRSWTLMRMALPLGIATTMAALNLNMPRYFIHARLGEKQLGIYSAMAYATVAMVLVIDSLSHSAIPRLSRLYMSGQLREYRALLLRLVVAGGGLGLAGTAVARLMGARLLTIVYGPEYAAHYRVFLRLMLAASIYCVACMLTTAVTSARCFRIQAPLYTLVAASNALACAWWVPRSGLTGGASAMVLASGVHLALGAAMVAYLLWGPAGRKASIRHPQACLVDWEASL